MLRLHLRAAPRHVHVLALHLLGGSKTSITSLLPLRLQVV